jgi:hypothetical protein
MRSCPPDLPHALVADLHRSWPGSRCQETLITFSLVAGLRPTPGPGSDLNWEPPYGIEP